MFRVVLIKNGEYKKTLHRCRTRETSFLKFRSLKEENKSVLFPKQNVNYNKINKVDYKICVVKDTEEGDKFRMLRDSYGKLYEEAPLGDWTILHDSEYQIEETFWLFGKSPKNDRVTIHDVIKLIMSGVYKKQITKQVIVVHNKLIIHNEEQFDMVICKCLEDAQRLHHALNKALRSNKIKNVLFMGTASQATISRMYDLIKEKTGWPIQKIWRTTTRP
jgi:hypothetical protein